MSKDLHDQIMNIACRRADDTFLNQASRLLYKEGHRDARHDAAELALAASGGNAAPGLTDEQIDAIRDTAIVNEMERTQRIFLTKKEERRAFARAIEAASAPNAALVEALQGLLNCDKNGSFGARVEAVNRAVAALSAAGQEVGHG